jgi:hypothetical protein
MADAIPTLSISTEKICFVALKAREFDVKDADMSSDEDGSNPADDRMVEVLEDRPDDPVDQELVAFMDQNVIRDIKVAAAQDKIKLSHVVEEAVREWLARRKH